MLQLEGKVAIVTGAAQGIGAAVMRVLLEQGAHVAAIDINKEKLNHLVSQLNIKKDRIQGFHTDVSKSAEVEQTVAIIEEQLGSIDILVNVAGILRMGSIENFNDEDWKETFQVNTTGVFNMCRAVSKKMKSRQQGAIVTISSNAASVPRMFMSAYAASKAATTMFMKCLGLELASYNIRCNVVSPGSTETEMQTSIWENEHGERTVINGSLEQFRVGIPLKKIAQPVDVAKAVLFLISDDSSHITMHDIRVDGGATLGA